MNKTRKQKTVLRIGKTSSIIPFSKDLFENIRSLIETTRNQVARLVNTGLVLLYWQIGERILKEILSKR